MGDSRPLLGLLLTTLLAAPAGADSSAVDTASAWLERMNRAVRTLDYQGRFVYQYGDHLEALYIRHSDDERGRDHERLVSLNGSVRQVVRDDDTVICLMPRAEKLDVDRRAVGRSLSPILPIRPGELAQHYRFEVGDQTRVAGRKAQEIVILPRDNLRYGYRLALDGEHALPLRTAMLDQDGRVVSQIMFTELRVGEAAEEEHEPLPDIPSPPESGHKGNQRDRAFLMKPAGWRFLSPPSGFVLSLHRRYAKARGGADVEHFVFSDGLATVSVYVEPLGGHGVMGATHVGPVNVYGRQVDGHQVTVVGEVPTETLQLFGDNITRVAAAR